MPRKPKQDAERSWIAHHEAAHAVATLRLRPGQQNGGATIVAHGSTLGTAGSDDPTFADPKTIEAGVVELLAGYFGAVRAGCPMVRARNSACSDDEKAADLLQIIGGKRATFKKRAARLVAREWKAIAAVARELLAHETLDDVEVELAADVTRPQALAELAEYRARRAAAFRAERGGRHAT